MQHPLGNGDVFVFMSETVEITPAKPPGTSTSTATMTRREKEEKVSGVPPRN